MVLTRIEITSKLLYPFRVRDPMRHKVDVFIIIIIILKTISANENREKPFLADECLKGQRSLSSFFHRLVASISRASSPIIFIAVLII